MLRYFVKRILSTIPVLLIISVIVFSMIHLTPGDPAQSMLGPEASEEQVESLRKAMGLYDPLPVQYVNWIADILHGDFGTSVANNEPVLSAIRSHMGPTISVTLFALVIDLLIALPLGILAARKKGSAADQLVSVVSLLGVSLPDFLIGLFLMLLFAVKLKWLPSSGYVPLSNGLIAHLRSITLPSIALGFTYPKRTSVPSCRWLHLPTPIERPEPVFPISAAFHIAPPASAPQKTSPSGTVLSSSTRRPLPENLFASPSAAFAALHQIFAARGPSSQPPGYSPAAYGSCVRTSGGFPAALLSGREVFPA